MQNRSSLHREGDRGLVVLDSGEDTRLGRGDGGVAGDDNTKDVTLHRDTERKRSDIEEKEVSGLVGSLTSQDSGLDGSTVGNSLIGVDGLVELTATEVLRNEGLDLRDTGGTANENDIINLVTGDLGVLQNTLDGVDRGLEQRSIDLLETSTGDIRREVLTLQEDQHDDRRSSDSTQTYLEERVDLDGGLSDTRESALGTLASSTETTEGTGVGGDILEK